MVLATGAVGDFDVVGVLRRLQLLETVTRRGWTQCSLGPHLALVLPCWASWPPDDVPDRCFWCLQMQGTGSSSPRESDAGFSMQRGSPSQKQWFRTSLVVNLRGGCSSAGFDAFSLWRSSGVVTSAHLYPFDYNKSNLRFWCGSSPEILD